MDNDIKNILDDAAGDRATELTEAQKHKILEIWAKSTDKRPPSLINCTEAAWGAGTDPRTWKGKLVTQFLISNNLKPKLQQDYIKKEKPVLTPEHKEFIANNFKVMGILELAREVFQNPNLTPLHMQTRTVAAYIREELNPIAVKDDVQEQEENDLENDIYIVPRTIAQAIARVNRYLMNGIDPTKYNSMEKKCMQALMGYLSTRRFNVVINSFNDVEDRILFESEFIRCTYDKPDLTPEECDQYIIYSTEVIIGQQILSRISKLEQEQDTQLEQNDGRMNLALVEGVKSLRDEYNKCVKRQNDLLDALKGKRKEKLELAVKENASILNLVNLWKEETTRKQLIDLANKNLVELKKEYDRLSSMEEVKAKIFGISEEEILHG